MSEKKNKTEFKESGEFGVGETEEDIRNLDVFDTLVSMDEFKDLTKDLDETQTKHVMKEAAAYSDQYQKILDQFTKTLSTPEGKKMFERMLRKKAGQR
jgi:hypothetical protein